jgi:hypothetical protein
MGFMKEKTIVVGAEDFVKADALNWAEYEHEGLHYVVQVAPDRDCPYPRNDRDTVWTWTRGVSECFDDDRDALSLDDWDGMDAKTKEKYLWRLLGVRDSYHHNTDTVYVAKSAFTDKEAANWVGARGQVTFSGVAYVLKKDAVNAVTGKKGGKFTEYVKEKAFQYLDDEVSEANLWLHGEVYGCIVTCIETEEEESCWGFLCDDWKEMKARVKEMIPEGVDLVWEE